MKSKLTSIAGLFCLALCIGCSSCTAPSFATLLSEGNTAVTAITGILETDGKISASEANDIAWADTSATMIIDCTDAKTTSTLAKINACVSDAQTILSTQPLTSNKAVTSNVSTILALAAAFVQAFTPAAASPSASLSSVSAYRDNFFGEVKATGEVVKASKVNKKKVAAERAKAEAIKARIEALKTKTR